MLKWKDKKLKTYGDIMDAIDEVESRKEAQKFIKLYDIDCKGNAIANIKYMLGYWGDIERAEDVKVLFSISNGED